MSSNNILTDFILTDYDREDKLSVIIYLCLLYLIALDEVEQIVVQSM